jgi:transcription initiation factor TFIIIB Brf1 subunit/transcription initiation factor TFIIB
MITCPNCQHLEYEGELLCSNCGKPLKSKPTASGKGTKTFDPDQLRQSTAESAAATAAPALQPGQIALVMVTAPQPLIFEARPEYILGREGPVESGSEVIDFGPYSGRELGVSRQHASLRVTHHQLLLMDLGSTNGTRLKGALLSPHQPARVENGAEIRLGKLPLKIYFQF